MSAKEDSVFFTITGNGTDYIDVADEFNSPNLQTISDVLKVGDQAFATNGDKTVPIFVNFFNPFSAGELRGNSFVIKQPADNVSEIVVPVIDNTINSITVDGDFVATFSTVDDSEALKQAHVYTSVFSGFDFSLNRLAFTNIETFNNQRSSTSLSHHHGISLLGFFISGVIDSFGEVGTTFVDINVTAENLSDPLLVSNGTLLSGAIISMFDPENFALTYTAEVVSHTATKIRLKKRGSEIFNLNGANPKLVSPGFQLLIDSRNYGETTDVVYESDYIVDRKFLTENTFLNGDTFTVSSTSGLVVGENVALYSRTGATFTSKISEIVDSDTFKTDNVAPFDFLVIHDSYVDFLYTDVRISEEPLTVDASVDDTTVSVASTSGIVVGDIIFILDNKGLIHETIVKSIPSATLVELDDALESDFLISDNARISVRRGNFTGTHSHFIKNGEFDVVTDSRLHLLGFPAEHAHVVEPFIRNVSDLKLINGVLYAVGSRSSIYSSFDNGVSWGEEIDTKDFFEFIPVASFISKIMSDKNNNILFGAESGYLIYKSTFDNEPVVPLKLPF
jgi:hypothetical protein